MIALGLFIYLPDTRLRPVDGPDTQGTPGEVEEHSAPLGVSTWRSDPTESTYIANHNQHAPDPTGTAG